MFFQCIRRKAHPPFCGMHQISPSGTKSLQNHKLVLSPAQNCRKCAAFLQLICSVMLLLTDKSESLPRPDDIRRVDSVSRDPACGAYLVQAGLFPVISQNHRQAGRPAFHLLHLQDEGNMYFFLPHLFSSCCLFHQKIDRGNLIRQNRHLCQRKGIVRQILRRTNLQPPAIVLGDTLLQHPFIAE